MRLEEKKGEEDGEGVEEDGEKEGEEGGEGEEEEEIVEGEEDE